MEGQEDQVMEVDNSEINWDKSTDVHMSCDLGSKKPNGYDLRECKSDNLSKDSKDLIGQHKVAPLKSMEPKQKFDENEEKDESSSESCSSSFSLSAEETPEEKAEFVKYRNELKKKYGLDKLPKFDKMEKLSSKVKYYSIDRKRKHREEISVKDWHKLRIYKDDKYLEDWIKEDDSVSTMNVDRVNASDITVEEFMEKYEKPGVPVILLGWTENWDALSWWNFADLINKYGKWKLKVGEDDEGYPLKLRLKHFIEYMLYNKDDSPLYLFQSSIESRKKIKDLVKDYSVPKFFQDDYFKILGSNTRPPFRWFLMGPRRSGTTMHWDPLSTSAWNTSLVGHKKWLLFPPNYTKEFAKGKKYKQKGEDDEAIHYFKTIYPRIIEGEKSRKEIWICSKTRRDCIYTR